MRIDVGVEPVFGQLVPEWESLAARTAASPFLQPGWAIAWMQAFGRGRVQAVTVREGDRLSGVLPLRRQRGGALTSPTNWHTPQFGALTEGAAASEALYAHLMAQPAHMIDLRFVDVDGPEVTSLRAAAQSAGRRVVVRPLQRSPRIRIDGAWDEFSARLDGKFRRELRRRCRRLAELGSVTFDVTTGTGRDDLGRALQEGFAVEALGWKGHQRTAIASNPATERFYTSVARWASERGWLRLGFLRVDGKPVAFDLALEHAGNHYLLKTGYDPSLGQLSPGLLLREAMIRRAFDLRLRSYELLGAEAPWKSVWATSQREIVAIQVFSRSPAGWLGWMAQRKGRPLAGRAARLAKRGTRAGRAAVSR